jgi:hypothetical protein
VIRLFSHFTAAALIGTVTSSPAQSVYRCGPDGRTYSQQPCRDGRSVDVDDSRTADQQAQAQRAAQRDAQLGQAMQQDRQAVEAAAARRQASGIHSLRLPAPAQSVTGSATKGKAKRKAGKPRVSDEDGAVFVQGAVPKAKAKKSSKAGAAEAH